MTCERFQTTLVSEVPIATRVGKFTRNPFREPVSLQSTSSLTWPRREKNISKYRTSTLTTTIHLETLIYSAVLFSTKKKKLIYGYLWCLEIGDLASFIVRWFTVNFTRIESLSSTVDLKSIQLYEIFHTSLISISKKYFLFYSKMSD